MGAGLPFSAQALNYESACPWDICAVATSDEMLIVLF
jgi:hypothetical protein